VCGGPVVPSDGDAGDVARSDGELPLLVRSHRARAMALGWLAASFVLGAIAAMTVGVALLVGLASHLAAGVLGALALAAATLAVISVQRWRRRRREAAAELDAAWDRVAGEVLAARQGDTTAADLAKIMRTSVDHAEGLLSRLSAGGRARVDVRDHDAELAYRVSVPASEDAASLPAGEDAASAAADSPEAAAPPARTR
jgi:hypothetical protein